MAAPADAGSRADGLAARALLPADDVLARLGSRRTGLTSSEAAERVTRYGPNELPRTPSPPWYLELVGNCVHFFALMLWVASGLAVAAGMPQLGIAIVVIILLNGIFAFVQQYRAEQAAERLRDLLPRRATVFRGGAPRQLDARDLVVGDVVLLAAGDRVSADMTTLEGHGLAIDTSTLTGESVPAVAEAAGPLYAGTFVVEGEGLAVVTAIGMGTRLASIARLTRAGHRPPSPLARELERVVRTIAAIAVAVGGVFFGAALLLGLPASDGFLFALGVTVALVPEGLLPTVTLSLAVGAQRMARRQALVRRLESVETLGSTTFICTDKTGTLTCNEMAVVEVWTPAGAARIEGEGYEPTATIYAEPGALPSLRELALVAARCSTGHAVVDHDGRWTAEGDPMEAALDVLMRRLGVTDAVAADTRARPVGRRFPFDPRRRRMSLVAGDRLLVKGAPEAILSCCWPACGAEQALDAMVARGLRVLAIARRSLSAVDTTRGADTLEAELDLLGVVGMEDPPRPEAAVAIAACRQAGIRIAMITGDHPSTARAIAREVGLLGPEEIVLQGQDLPSDEEELGRLLDRDGVVVSRVAPEDKLRIARALHQRGHVVAMTGDGVNDGPALQVADIGIAMGRSGTDVAREAADLVLLDDDFATIVEAIKQGRATFSNIRRALTYHVTDNVAELTPFVAWALSGGQIPLALGVLQILCLDVGTDQLPALALGVEAPVADVLRQPPRRGHLIDGAMLRRVFFLLGPVEAVVEMVAFLVVLTAAGWRLGEAADPSVLLAASGAAFSAVIVAQAANAFACRSASRWPGALGWTTNRLLLVGVAVEFLLLAIFLLIPPAATVLGQASPPLGSWVAILVAAPALLAADAVHKWLHARAHAKTPKA